MKKSLVMILVVILVLSMQVCFAAFPDIEGSRYKEAIEYLNSASIVAGYEDNTYRPEKVVTRAEMAKFLVTTMKADIENVSSSSEFLDVPNWHWAVKYINAAQKNELIKGDGDGNFRPDDTVSYGEAFTMVVRMLGYDVDIEGTGVWPNNYIDRAKELNLTDNVESFTNAQGANRGSIAQIIYNAINKVYTKEEYPLISLVNKAFDMINNPQSANDLYANDKNSLKTNFSFDLDINTDNAQIKDYLDEETKDLIEKIENLVNNSEIDIQFKYDLLKEYAQYIIEYFFENEELLEVEVNIDKNKVYVFIKDVFDKYLKGENEESFFEEIFASSEMDESEKKLMKVMEKAIFKKIMELDKKGKDTTIKINGNSKDVIKYSFEIDDYDVLDIQKYMYEEILNSDDLINTIFAYDFLTLEEKKELLRETIDGLEVLEDESVKIKIDLYMEEEKIVGLDIDYTQTYDWGDGDIEKNNAKITFRIDEERYLEGKVDITTEEMGIEYGFIAKQDGKDKYDVKFDLEVKDLVEFAINGKIENSKEEITKPSFKATVEELDEETQARLTAKLEEIVEKVGFKKEYEEYLRQQQEMLNTVKKTSFYSDIAYIRSSVIMKSYENKANNEQHKYTGVLDRPLNIENDINPDVIIKGINIWKISSNNTLEIDIDNITDYGIDVEGNVYYIKGLIIDGDTYYNQNTFVEGIVPGAVKLEDY